MLMRLGKLPALYYLLLFCIENHLSGVLTKQLPGKQEDFPTTNWYCSMRRRVMEKRPCSPTLPAIAKFPVAGICSIAQMLIKSLSYDCSSPVFVIPSPNLAPCSMGY